MLDVQDITVAYSSNAEPTIEGFHLEMKPGEICSPVRSLELSEKAEAGRLR